MATTRIIPMHRNKGKTIAQCLHSRTEYAKNPDKTNGGEMVSSFACAPITADAEFLLSKREYKMITGRSQERDVIAYQMRQSFRPGEITPEEANRIGYEFAARFLKDNHAFLVATHIDKAHIHNHIIWNSTSLDSTCKFRNFWGSARAMRCLSDTICLEHGLSIIENPQVKQPANRHRLGDQRPPTFRELIRADLDRLLAEKPADFDALKKRLQEVGYEIKDGKQPALRGADQKRFIRFDTLGDAYSQAQISTVLAGKAEHIPQKKSTYLKSPEQDASINLLVDIQAKLRAGKGAGYEQWAKKFNLKQMAKAMNYLAEHHLTYGELSDKTEAAAQEHHRLSEKIRAAEKRISEIAVLKTHILNYIKTRDVYVDYRKAGYSAKFRAAHDSEILLHQAAKKAFDELGLKKLPTVKSLNAEYAKLLAVKKTDYAAFRIIRSDMKELLTVKANLDEMLNGEKSSRKREEKRER